jgi:hypothetical protein
VTGKDSTHFVLRADASAAQIAAYATIDFVEENGAARQD